MTAVGSRNCRNCQLHATHQLDSCGHVICNEHLDIVAVGSSTRIFNCGICNEIVTNIKPITPITNLSTNSYNNLTEAEPDYIIKSRQESGWGRIGLSRDQLRGVLPESNDSAPADMTNASLYIQSDNHLTRNEQRSVPMSQPVSSSTAAALADFIRSGGYEVSMNANGNRRNSNQPIAMQRPLIRHWASHMVQTIANPPFMIATGRAPSFHQAIQYLPFHNPASFIEPSQKGVVQLTNIPYLVTKAEITAALGRNARIASQPAGTPFYAIHIIVDRSSGKTMDCFVEVDTYQEAVNIVKLHAGRSKNDRKLKVGERQITINLSSQAQLMAEMFPKAKCVVWNGQEAQIHLPRVINDSGFLGFVTGEELSATLKQADNPLRSSFIARQPSRAYEGMISLLYKYPWFSSKYITIAERTILFRTCRDMIKALIKQLSFLKHNYNDNSKDFSNMNVLGPHLLQELVCAVLTVPFSRGDKSQVIKTLFLHGYEGLIKNIGYEYMTTDAFWPFHVLDRKDGVSLECVEFYASMLRQAADAKNGVFHVSDNPFGIFKVWYPCSDMRLINLHDAAMVEMKAITDILGGFLPIDQTNRLPCEDALSNANSSTYSTIPNDPMEDDTLSPIRRLSMGSTPLTSPPRYSSTFDLAPGSHLRRSSTITNPNQGFDNNNNNNNLNLNNGQSDQTFSNNLLPRHWSMPTLQSNDSTSIFEGEGGVELPISPTSITSFSSIDYEYEENTIYNNNSNYSVFNNSNINRINNISYIRNVRPRLYGNANTTVSAQQFTTPSPWSDTPNASANTTLLNVGDYSRVNTFSGQGHGLYSNNIWNDSDWSANGNYYGGRNVDSDRGRNY